MDQELGETNQRVDQSRAGTDAAAIGGVNEVGGSNSTSSDPGPNKVMRDDEERGGKCQSCVIDIKCDDFVRENQSVCRICLLSAKESGLSPMELMEIGCGCKGELAVAHSHCAEAWFRVRGNRLCEICGQTAKNITGVGSSRFMEEWHESRSAGSGISSANDSRRCLQGQPLCNFIMACLVIAFVLPWFFRVNMF